MYVLLKRAKGTSGSVHMFMCCPKGMFDTGSHSPRVTKGQGFFNHGYLGYRLHSRDNKREHDHMHSIEQIQYPADDYSLVPDA